MAETTWLAERFEQHRPRLRLSRSDTDGIDKRIVAIDGIRDPDRVGRLAAGVLSHS